MLIIYAHPNKLGHNGYILKQLKEEFKRQKPQVLDLYKIKYAPTMSQKELYTSGGRIPAKDTLKFQRLLKKHRKIIIIYPTWWNSTPAILKGFFDRVLTSKFAFKYDSRGIPKGLLKGKVAVVTTTGSSSLMHNLLQGGRSLKIVAKDTLKFCGYESKGFLIGSATHLTDKRKRKIEKLTKKISKYIKTK
jgi:NAD(P)H dehydrogenase (quinone)